MPPRKPWDTIKSDQYSIEKPELALRFFCFPIGRCRYRLRQRNPVPERVSQNRESPGFLIAHTKRKEQGKKREKGTRPNNRPGKGVFPAIQSMIHLRQERIQHPDKKAKYGAEKAPISSSHGSAIPEAEQNRARRPIPVRHGKRTPPEDS